MQEWNSPVTEVTLTYSSADVPVFVASTSADLTGSVSPGMRLRVSQSTGGTKYFIVVAITSNSVTLYGGTDYTLNNETISSPVFSSAKAPVGFPLNPNKWTVETINTSDITQSSPADGTWYNAVNIVIPIGIWDISYFATLYLNKTGVSPILDGGTTLSTGNNSESDSEFTSRMSVVNENIVGRMTARKTLLITSETTYYLNMMSRQSSISTVGILGNPSSFPNSKTIVRAICAYL